MGSKAFEMLDSIDPITGAEGKLFYSVKAFDQSKSFHIGRSSHGNAVLLVSTATLSPRAVPLQLSGIEAVFDVICIISEDGVETEARFTVVSCQSKDREVEVYFSHIAGIIVDELGDLPCAEKLEASISQLIFLFEKLKSPPRNTIHGLIGELLVIDLADRPDQAVLCWHNEATERYDFSGGQARLEAKTWSSGTRQHTFSADQVNLPVETVGILASSMVEESSGGVSVSELAGQIERRLSTSASITQLRIKIAGALGINVEQSQGYRFDLARAHSTIAFYDINSLPGIRPPYPPGVSRISFTSNLTHLTPLEISHVNVLILPELNFSISRKVGGQL
ncbi:PD-(D/E)XK motif protein [Agrobacterium tumefaciens]|uniref:PD-(D/E)XK motif protein n=1 Tax=Agrobacterium tumefaciens TaxID=358 RepID=A0AAP9E7J4_AGRTU|nr:PD-(D/E)XK motif protein [Agrobacterium tumefaciens]NSZ59884.1 PD-(D/E)XK motif protein [Agrobacterium tumefaciens]QDY96313.1 PD-(D/E)XK motif protein [Agrobacterium tumefaciens]UXS46560.1 PD-(D/E)XK motif protein [Agrobacterium tumefaciens]UXS72857.1 PD-(D/E)XK motif protein [Agrobacterium tumefaciens]UXS80308.1 PD-(D/E)XK motif protein [Agrobacterium tumefaciens]